MSAVRRPVPVLEEEGGEEEEEEERGAEEWRRARAIEVTAGWMEGHTTEKACDDERAVERGCHCVAAARTMEAREYERTECGLGSMRAISLSGRVSGAADVCARRFAAAGSEVSSAVAKREPRRRQCVAAATAFKAAPVTGRAMAERRPTGDDKGNKRAVWSRAVQRHKRPRAEQSRNSAGWAARRRDGI